MALVGRLRTLSFVALAVTGGAACQSSNSDAPAPAPVTTGRSPASGDEAGSSDGAGAALALCTPLRDWVNQLASIANETTDAVVDLDDPAARADRTLEGYDELIEATEQFRTDLDDVRIDGTTDGQRAADDLRTGADDAVAALVDERSTFESDTAGRVTDDDLPGRMGQFLISLETAYSASEPALADYDDVAFQEAVLSEPTCEHVVQPFRLD